MVSDLAPIDLLLQRAGRIWRHPHRKGRRVRGPKLLVLSPDPNGAVTRDWLTALLPRAGWVYRNHALLWLSAREIFAREMVRVPEDVRGLVEAVYGEEAEASAPTALERYWTESKGNDQAARAVADMNLLRLGKGYGGEEQGEGRTMPSSPPAWGSPR
jgi:CRISPR-associated endonuclease/helicase Cas3